MTTLQAIILGIIEGATEYLPISSTFHLIWSSKFLGIPTTEFQKAFEVIIQSGAILAVISLYLKTVLSDYKLIKNLIVSFIPTGIIGFVLYKTIKTNFFESFYTQIFIFFAVGVIFILFEKWDKHRNLKKTLQELTPKEAILVGIIQALAVFPGVSRAGAVILALMFFKVNRREAAKYSFLLAVPTLLSASILDLIKSKDAILGTSGNFQILLVGFVASFISAYFVVKWFILFLQKKDLSSFGWYRIGVAAVLFLITR